MSWHAVLNVNLLKLKKYLFKLKIKKVSNHEFSLSVTNSFINALPNLMVMDEKQNVLTCNRDSSQPLLFSRNHTLLPNPSSQCLLFTVSIIFQCKKKTRHKIRVNKLHISYLLKKSIALGAKITKHYSFNIQNTNCRVTYGLWRKFRFFMPFYVIYFTLIFMVRRYIHLWLSHCGNFNWCRSIFREKPDDAQVFLICVIRGKCDVH